MTLVKEGEDINSKFNNLTNMSDGLVEKYARVIDRASPDFVHVKGFTSVGYARNRMGYDKQPWFCEVKDYAKKILEELEKKDARWKILGEDKRSCVIVLSRLEKKDMKIRKV